MHKIPPNPSNGQEVYNWGAQVDYTTSKAYCCWYCYCSDEYWYRVFDITTNACGGNGGNGGNGGDGGGAGSLTLISWRTGDSSIEVVNTRIKSNGGSPGSGGVQASGVHCNRHFTGYRRYWTTPACHGYGNYICETRAHETYGGYGYTNNDQDCPGLHGVKGTPGINWEP